MNVKNPRMDCDVPGCVAAHEARGYCGRHYMRWKRTGDPLKTTTPDPYVTLPRRFWAKVDKVEGGCWLWTAAQGPFGYGRIAMGRDAGPQPAHRVSWEMHIGPIPLGLEVNPAHLFLGTQAENMADMARKGRASRAGFKPGENSLILRRRKEAGP